MVLMAARQSGFRMWSFSTIRSADHAGGGTIGIMGGTFDPVHNGHLAAARQLQGVADLDEAWLMPNATPPHHTAGRSRRRKTECGWWNWRVPAIPRLFHPA